MSLPFKGLAKLSEECGEVVQIATKLLDRHTKQRTTTLRDHLEQEIGDMLAAVEYVSTKMKLDKTKIEKRKELKFKRYHNWR